MCARTHVRRAHASRGDLGPISARSRPDLGQISGRSRADLACTCMSGRGTTLDCSPWPHTSGIEPRSWTAEERPPECSAPRDPSALICFVRDCMFRQGLNVSDGMITDYILRMKRQRHGRTWRSCEDTPAQSPPHSPRAQPHTALRSPTRWRCSCKRSRHDLGTILARSRRDLGAISEGRAYRA